MDQVTLKSSAGKWILAATTIASGMAFFDGSTTGVALLVRSHCRLRTILGRLANADFWLAVGVVDQRPFGTGGINFNNKIYTRKPEQRSQTIGLVWRLATGFRAFCIILWAYAGPGE